MADIPLYRGTEHPEDWMRQVQTRCLFQKINNEKEVLKVAKLNITSSITSGIPAEINTVDELIKTLREHPTFAIYKNDCKQRLDQMIFEGGDTAQFIADFRALITKAEITKPDDIKNRLLRTYASNDFFRNEFARRTSKITDIDEIYKTFSNVVADDLEIIKYGPDCSIYIRHVATGKYLTSDEIPYLGGSQRQVVFAGKELQGARSKWYLKCENPIPRESFQEGRVFYEDVVYLTHKKTGYTLNLSDFFKAPITHEGAEVHCFQFAFANFHFVKTDQTNIENETSYVKSKDTLYLKLENGYMLRSHDVTFAIGDKSFQEVIGHREKVGRDDEWQIEIK